jgi:unsaturated rhamnogalacturonyl hydrolase
MEMHTTSNKFYFVSSFIFLITIPSFGQPLPPKEQILEKMVIANSYFMKKWTDAGQTIVTNQARPSNIWTRGVYYEGLMALYKVKPDTSFLNYALRWAEFHKWGLRNGITTRNADNQCCGQTYIDLYLIDHQPERIGQIKASIDSMVKTPKIDDWSWIDALQMAMPVFAQLGTIYKDNRYFERMYEMYMFSKTKHGGSGLYNPKDRLWWRDKDFVFPYKEPNGEDCYWARGNGWVVAALVRVLDIMPPDAPNRKEYQRTLLKMIGALVPIQRKDGFWNVSLHDSTHFGGKELTGTALFVYGMAWGINNGLLNAKKYKPIIAKAWNAMVSDCIHTNGMLGWVQGTGKEPKDGQPLAYDKIPDFEDYGLGCFLLAGSEVYKMK